MMYAMHIERWNGSEFIYVGTISALANYAEAVTLSHTICGIDSPYACRIELAYNKLGKLVATR